MSVPPGANAIGIPTHLLLSSLPFPSPSTPHFHATPTLQPPTTLSYHFASDPPYDPNTNTNPLSAGSGRTIVWDTERGKVTSLSEGVVATGVRSERSEGGGEGVWVVDLLSAPGGGSQDDGEGLGEKGEGEKMGIGELLRVLRRQEELIARIEDGPNEEERAGQS